MLDPCLPTVHILGGAPRARAGQTADASEKVIHRWAHHEMSRTRAAGARRGMQAHTGTKRTIGRQGEGSPRATALSSLLFLWPLLPFLLPTHEGWVSDLDFRLIAH